MRVAQTSMRVVPDNGQVPVKVLQTSMGVILQISTETDGNYKQVSSTDVQSLETAGRHENPFIFFENLLLVSVDLH